MSQNGSGTPNTTYLYELTCSTVTVLSLIIQENATMLETEEEVQEVQEVHETIDSGTPTVSSGIYMYMHILLSTF